jgi:hypothetical protein
LHDPECITCDEWDEHPGHSGEINFEPDGNENGIIYNGFKYDWVVDGICESDCYREEWCGTSWVGFEFGFARDYRIFGYLTSRELIHGSKWQKTR